MPSGSTDAATQKRPQADHPLAFDSSAKWERSAKIGLRPEPFGALAYHFDTRRLVFLKSPVLVELVDGLVDHDSADAAIEAIVEPADNRGHQAHVKALASLAEAGVIEPVTTAISFVG
jgi:mycofactocin biosynthesis protein MftB